MTEQKPEIKIEDLAKLDVRVGTIIAAEAVTGSSKLIKLQVDFGSLGQRQILTGMQKWYKPEDFMGMQTTFVVNLAPRKMMGLESQGMIFALGLTDESTPVFLVPKQKVENGEGAR
jgi:methionine--tRNA ligase beta chain